jgi:T5orf172 domain
MSEKGYVYILTNPSMPNIIKVGRSICSIMRAKQLSNTSLPTPFEVFGDVFTWNSLMLERLVHKMLKATRVNSDREFFMISPEKAMEILSEAQFKVDDYKNEVSLRDAIEGELNILPKIKNTIRIPGVTRLQALPEVFNIDTMVQTFGCSRKDASIYCGRWKNLGLVEPLVEWKSGVYFNLLKNPSSPGVCLFDAIAMICEGPLILIGATALNHAGWTTQSPQRPEIAVRIERGHASLPNIDHALLCPRYPRRFSLLLDHASEDVGLGNSDVRTLQPAMAIADSLVAEKLALGDKHRRAWSSFAGDLDLELLEENLDEVRKAFYALGQSEVETEAMITPLLIHERFSSMKC